MSDFYKVTFVGNLGRDPEMRYTPGGQAVTSFSVASNRRYTDSSGQKVEETIWTRVSAWGKLAESCKEYLSKGRQVLVEGRLVPDRATGGPRLFQRTQDNSWGASYEVSAERVQFLGNNGNGTAHREEAAVAVPSAEEIPF